MKGWGLGMRLGTVWEEDRGVGGDCGVGCSLGRRVARGTSAVAREKKPLGGMYLARARKNGWLEKEHVTT